jgi:hypothetical protein
MRRYDRYDYELRRRAGGGRYDAPGPWTGWYPGAYGAGAPMFGFAGMEAWGWPPYAPIGRGEPPRSPRRRPRESAAYGRGGDQAVRRWAERYGYDIEYSIRPGREGPGRGRHGHR